MIDPATGSTPSGLVTATVGGVVSFSTTIDTPAAMRVLPAASRATAAMTCGPLATVALFHVMTYGAVRCSAPRFAPSSVNWTPATPTSSEAGAPNAMTPVTVAPATGLVTATVGAETSLPTVTVTEVAATAWPAASRAIAEMACGPLATPAVFQLNV